VDPVPDPLLIRKSGSAENRTRTSGSVARNSDHWTIEAVEVNLNRNYGVDCTMPTTCTVNNSLREWFDSIKVCLFMEKINFPELQFSSATITLHPFTEILV
jgi:hypothetical protein